MSNNSKGIVQAAINTAGDTIGCVIDDQILLLKWKLAYNQIFLYYFNLSLKSEKKNIFDFISSNSLIIYS